MKEQTRLDEFMENEEFARIMAQEDLIMDVTEGLCGILETKNIKRTLLAEWMGKTRGYISQLLNGGKNLTLRSIADIAYHLGYTAEIKFKLKETKRSGRQYKVDWNERVVMDFKDKNIQMADDYCLVDDDYAIGG